MKKKLNHIGKSNSDLPCPQLFQNVPTIPDLTHFKIVGVGIVCIYLIHIAKRNLKSQLSVIRVLWVTNLAFSFIAVSNVVVYFIQKSQN